MLKVDNDIKPSQDVLDSLKNYQDEIDILPTFDEKREKAKNLFKARNVKTNRTFEAVKVALKEISPGIERCVYCEDSQCDEVEHFYPKTLYPQFCFDWSNYFYACGVCNGPKNNQFAVFRHDNGAFYKVNPANNKQPIVEPPAGDSVLINPRIDDPFSFCILDLETFNFSIIADLDKADLELEDFHNYIRADYTFNEVLRLNQRPSLRKRREAAFHDYKDRLQAYTNNKNSGATQDKLDRIVQRLKKSDHPTVWAEMQWHYSMGYLERIDENLHDLFEQSPEALDW